MFARVLALFAILAAFGCAGHPDVRPGADGVHRVVVQGEDTDEASKSAIRQAQDYCKEKKMEAAFMDENKKYTGNMDESTYHTTKTVGKVAQVVGGGVWAMGGDKESPVGGLVGLGGTAARDAAGNGYTVEMRFKCQ
jgi:hypothetical protein